MKKNNNKNDKPMPKALIQAWLKISVPMLLLLIDAIYLRDVKLIIICAMVFVISALSYPRKWRKGLLIEKEAVCKDIKMGRDYRLTFITADSSAKELFLCANPSLGHRLCENKVYFIIYQRNMGRPRVIAYSKITGEDDDEYYGDWI